MKKSGENRDQLKSKPDDTFLKDGRDKKGMADSHRSYLGLNAPSDYFSTSRNDILASVSKAKKEKGHNPVIRFIVPVAASIAILIGIATVLWFHNTTVTNGYENSTVDVEYFPNGTDNALIALLFIDDSEIDQYVDGYLIEKVIADACDLEDNLDNILFNSLFIDDSLMNQYVDKQIIKSIVL